MSTTEREARERRNDDGDTRRDRTRRDVSELHVPAARPVLVVRFQWGEADSSRLRGIDVGLRWGQGRES